MTFYQRFLIITLTSVLGFCSSAAYAENFIAKIDQSKWEITAKTPFLCELSHTIPGFGTATFFHEPNRPLRLKLKSRYHFKQGLEVYFKSVSAYWKTPKTETTLATIKIGKNNSFNVGEPYARQAFFELESGNFPSFFFFDEQNRDVPVGVALSTVRFKNKISDFQDCVAQLYPDNFNDVKEAYIHFDFDQEFPIQKEEDTALKAMVKYAKADKRVTRFMVTGHTDERGRSCYNNTLSERRALYVFDLLQAEVTDDHKVEYQFLGESQPLDTRKNEQAWAKNRRVKVEMFRD